jgi:methylphosphotriester-DNA--protein-cysteine methyltransferase
MPLTMSERLFLRLDGDANPGPESGAPAGSLHGAPVSPALRPAVSHLLLYREHIPDGTEVLERVLPDGAVRLAFNLGAAPTAGGGAGEPTEAIGASVKPALVRMRGTIEGVSVTLRPGAASVLLGLPAAELMGTAVRLDDLWHGEGARVLERMMEAPDDRARLSVLQEALHQRLSRHADGLHAGTMRAARLITASGGSRPLREVADAIGVGERRLQQLFHAHVGLSPRAFSRLARLHACLRLLRQQRTPSWARVAVDAGFYDQPHLANEFRALCGLSPTEFLARTVSGSSKTES